MSVSREPQPDGFRREAAAAWHVRLQAGNTTEADWLDFEAWLADPANRAAMDALEAGLQDVEENAAEIMAALSGSDTASYCRRGSGSRLWPAPGWLAGAGLAAAAGLLFLVAPVLMPQTAPERMQEFAYSAPQDAPLAVALPDGSTARLNRGAALKVRWSGGERRVELLGGEAAFKVVHNEKQPFIVSAGNTTIKDVGTEFNVLSRPAGLVVTVREGVIELATSGLAPARVAAGHQLVLDVIRNEARLSKVEADDAFAWQEGRLVFRDATLEDVVDGMNRYGQTRISVEDASAKALRFSGVVMINSPDRMAEQLEEFLPVVATRSGSGIVIRSR